MSDRLEGRALELLREPNFANLATVNPDGSILAVVLWVDADAGGLVLVNGVEGRRWPANLRRSGQATVLVANRHNPHEYVSVVARLAGDQTTGAAKHFETLGRKYRGADAPQAPSGMQRVKLTLAPIRVRLYQG